jgi:hypothetical protein
VTRWLVLVALVLYPRPALSQDSTARHRRGLWGEFGFGPGYVRIACSGCGEDVVGATGATSYLRIGGVISKNVLIGFEVFSLLDKAVGFSPQDSSASAETGTAAIVIMWYPGRHGLYFKGGVGAAFGEFSIPASDSSGTVLADTSSGGGMGLTFGLGWDLPISRKFAFTGNAAAFVTALGDVVVGSRRVDDLIATMYQLSIGFTIR